MQREVGRLLRSHALDAELDRGLHPLEEPAVAQPFQTTPHLLVAGASGTRAEVVPETETDDETAQDVIDRAFELCKVHDAVKDSLHAETTVETGAF